MEIPRYLSLIGMGSFILLIQLSAIVMSTPMEEQGMQMFENPHEVSNDVVVAGFILLFTAIFLLFMKIGKFQLIQAIVMFSVWIVFVYGFQTILPAIFPLISWNFMLVSAAAIIPTILLYAAPKWWIIDLSAIFMGAVCASLFGISLGLIPVLILLIGLAIYDFISVYKTKHMITLAEGVIKLRIPILFVIPKRGKFSIDGKLGEDAYYMGLGDAVFPSILAVSANLPHLNPWLKGVATVGSVTLPCLGAIAGTLAGYGILSIFVGKGKPHAGLPLLNGGAIAGFLLGLLLGF